MKRRRSNPKKGAKARAYAGKKHSGTKFKSKGRWRVVAKLANGKRVSYACKAPKKGKG
jgi:hypothetical protein